MTTSVVVDSNIFIATVIPDSTTPQARALLKHWLSHDVQFFAPALFRYEVIAVIRKHIYRGSITPNQAKEAIEYIFHHKITFYLDMPLLLRGLDFANQFNFPTAYDSQYLSIAEHLKCEFWTGDKRLVSTVTPTLNWVKWLGDFSAS